MSEKKLLSSASLAEKHLNTVLNMVKGGDCNPLHAYILLKKIEALISGTWKEDGIIKSIRPDALDNASTYGERSFDCYGVTVSIKEVGGKYDYSNIGEIAEIEETLKKLKSNARISYKLQQQGKLMASEDGTVNEVPGFSGTTTTVEIRQPKN